MTAEEVIARLEQRDLYPKPTGPGRWQARCPAHDDRVASLSISVGAEDRTLVHCHAGCEKADVLSSLDLTEADLFAAAAEREAPIEYFYTRADGETGYKVARRPGKKFAQARPDGDGGWIWNLRGVERVLYQLPNVIAAVAAKETIFVCEGEKDTLALERAGVTATCNPGGAGKWRPEYSKSLAGANVVVIADGDEPGRKHAREVAASLKGIAAGVRIVEAAKGKDASDHLAAGLGVADFKDTDEETGPEEVGSTTASSIKPRRIRWAWQGRLAIGYLGIWSGESSLGKTLVACWMIAALTRGRLEGHLYGTPVDVLIVASEDARSDMWVPRLIVADADLDRVHFLDYGSDWDIRDGLDLAAREIGRHDAKLMFVDSVLEHLPDPKSSESIYQPRFIRRALRPFGDLVRDRQVAGLFSTHPPKAKGSTFAENVMASAAFVHVSRTGMLFAWHPDDLDRPDQQRRRVLLRPPGGSNIGRDPGTYEFSVRAQELSIEDELEEIPYVADLKPSEVTFRSLTRTVKEDAPAKRLVSDVKTIIDERLSDGQWHPSMLPELLEHGYLKTTIYDAAASTQKKQAASGWWWAAPSTPKGAFVELDRKSGSARARAGIHPGDRKRPPETTTNGSTETSSALPLDMDETAPPTETNRAVPTSGMPTRTRASNGAHPDPEDFLRRMHATNDPDEQQRIWDEAQAATG
jgi:putative DNA primase/helicase